jgi:hypothetical protein
MSTDLMNTFSVGQTVEVAYGPPVWNKKKGPVLLVDGEFLTVRLPGKDDGGDSTYDVILPAVMVKVA